MLEGRTQSRHAVRQKLILRETVPALIPCRRLDNAERLPEQLPHVYRRPVQRVKQEACRLPGPGTKRDLHVTPQRQHFRAGLVPILPVNSARRKPKPLVREIVDQVRAL